MNNFSLFSELKKSTFVSFYDCYVATATEAASRLDGQPMKVCTLIFYAFTVYFLLLQDPFGINRGTFNFKKILSRLESLYSKYNNT